MADILTAALSAVYRATNTAIPDWNTDAWPPYVIAPTKGEVNRFFAPVTPAFTYTFTQYSAVSLMAIWSLGSQLDITYNDGTRSVTQRVAAGGPLVVSVVSPAAPLQVSSLSGTTGFLLLLAGT